jgi:hypothetical protein
LIQDAFKAFRDAINTYRDSANDVVRGDLQPPSLDVDGAEISGDDGEGDASYYFALDDDADQFTDTAGDVAEFGTTDDVPLFEAETDIVGPDTEITVVGVEAHGFTRVSDITPDTQRPPELTGTALQ